MVSSNSFKNRKFVLLRGRDLEKWVLKIFGQFFGFNQCEML